MQPRPDLSLTIVLHNSARDLRDCLAALGPILSGSSAELIVVDNASDDDSVAIVTATCPSARIVTSSVNRGFAAGCNMAWPHVAGRYWLLLNPDIILPEGAASTLIEWMDRHAEVGAASAEIVDEHGNLQTAARRFPSISFSLLQLSRVHHLLARTLRGNRKFGTLARNEERTDIDWIPCAVMIVRRTAVEEAGLLSEDFFMYGEDIEWCWRLRRARWRIGICTAVRAEHRESSSALTTWGRAGTDERVVKGIHAAVSATRGHRYAWWLALIELAGRSIESFHPWRSAAHRQRARAGLGALAEIVMGRGAAPRS